MKYFAFLNIFFKFLSLSQHSTLLHLKTNTIDNPEMIRALLRPQIAIRQHAIYSWFWPLKIKVSRKSYTVITLWGCFTILAFKISKKLNCGLKIGILKMLSRYYVSSTHTASLEIWWHLIQKMTNLKKWKKCILGLKWGSGSKLNLEIFLKLYILFFLKILVS